ncbi:MAG TPA: hypothetical protein VKR29_03240, partial [Candidatus Binataceae bacterium]|nr:hypothetical protein [Candidatus Binataceae bacterium]
QSLERLAVALRDALAQLLIGKLRQNRTGSLRTRPVNSRLAAAKRERKQHRPSADAILRDP